MPRLIPAPEPYDPPSEHALRSASKKRVRAALAALPTRERSQVRGALMNPEQLSPGCVGWQPPVEGGEASPLESRVRRHLDDLGAFWEAQVAVGVYKVDTAVTSADIAQEGGGVKRQKIKLALECGKHEGPEALARDALKRNALRAEGWYVATVTDSTSHPLPVAIEAALACAGHDAQRRRDEAVYGAEVAARRERENAAYVSYRRSMVQPVYEVEGRPVTTVEKQKLDHARRVDRLVAEAEFHEDELAKAEDAKVWPAIHDVLAGLPKPPPGGWPTLTEVHTKSSGPFTGTEEEWKESWQYKQFKRLQSNPY